MAAPNDKAQLAITEQKVATVDSTLAEALRTDRDALNRRFALRQRGSARIDETAFREHLRTTVNDLTRAVAKIQPDRLCAVVQALFDVSLDLFVAGLLGAKTKHRYVAAAWQELLPSAARLLAREPARVAGSVSNAVDHLAAHACARPTEWIDGMCELAHYCDSVQQWLEAGKVLAWRAGLVQYRAAAMQILRALPWNTAVRCFGLSNEVNESEWQLRLDRLERDRWYSPSAPIPKTDGQALRIVCTTGGFLGFGGPCRQLPMVTANDAGLFASDGHGTWQLLADVFGVFWHRTAPSAAKGRSASALAVTVDSRGNIAWEGKYQFPELAEASSCACDGQTLAVTLPTSYLVFLLARTG